MKDFKINEINEHIECSNVPIWISGHADPKGPMGSTGIRRCVHSLQEFIEMAVKDILTVHTEEGLVTWERVCSMENVLADLSRDYKNWIEQKEDKQ